MVAWRKTYTAPDGKLQIALNGKTYKKYPVTEYTVSLTNLSQEEDTKIISDFQSFDFSFPIPAASDKVTLNTLRGSQCVPEDFSPIAVDLTANADHGIEVVRNHEEVLRNTGAFSGPIRIGEVTFSRGLYCHAESELVVRLPGPARTFFATIGIDHNRTTSGKRGSVRFSVECDGQPKYTSDVKRGGDPGEEIQVDLNHAGEFRMIADSTGDGISCDQAHWANARVLMEDGTLLYLDEMPFVHNVFSTPSGRSSNENMPFLEMNFDDDSGWLFAVAWTGGWAARFANDSKNANVKIGMINTHFKLLPGETVIQPGVAVFQREGKTRNEFKTLVHRFMLDHKVPRDTQGSIIPPIQAVTCGGGNKTPQMMLDILQYVIDNKFTFDTYWIDAGWYGAPHEDEHYSNCGPNWYKYVGDWRINTVTHPTGTLLPIADAVHKNNMKLLIWFEPERIYHETPIYSERPDFRNGPLLDMGNPEARKWIQDTLFDMIAKHNVNIYRQDFNMDPGPVWKAVDDENSDRTGIAEAKHIAGLYGFLDEMRERFPNILQENCASGGRRLDIEMATRAHAYCQSDYFIGPKPEDKAFILGQNATLNTTPYLPFHGGEFNCVPVGDDYAAFSIISSGTIMTFSDFDGGIIRREFAPEETEWFKKVFAFDARMKKFYLGNFYPLCDETPATDDVWCAWQFDRGDLDAGFAIIFRRGKASGESKTFSLGNIDPGADYDLEFYDGTKKTVKGSDLKQWKATLPPRGFQLFLYMKKS